MNDYRVLACVTCVKHNHDKDFPIVCPRIKLPCMAIHPQYINMDAPNPIEALLHDMTPTGRIGGTYIDKEFIQTMLMNFNQVKSKGITPNNIHY